MRYLTGDLESNRDVLDKCIADCQAEVERGGEWARKHLDSMSALRDEIDARIAARKRPARTEVPS